MKNEHLCGIIFLAGYMTKRNQVGVSESLRKSKWWNVLFIFTKSEQMNLASAYLPTVNNWTWYLHIYQQWTTEHGICIFTNSEQLNMSSAYLPKVNNWTWYLHIYQQWKTEHGICIFTNNEQLNMASAYLTTMNNWTWHLHIYQQWTTEHGICIDVLDNRKKLRILMREPLRQRDSETERRMDGFPLIELFHNKVTRLATFPQPTLQGAPGVP